MIEYHDIKLERFYLRSIIHVKGFVKEVYDDNEFGREVFSEKMNKTIFIALIEFYKRHNALPKKNVFKKYIIEFIEQNQILDKNQQIERYVILIENLFGKSVSDEDVSQIDEIRKQLIRLKKGRTLQKAIIDSSDYLEDGEVDRAEDVFINTKYEFLSTADLANEGDYVNDLKERQELVKLKIENPEKFRPIPSGISGWNPYNPFNDPTITGFDLFLDGGFYKGEFNLIVGESGHGKSFELMQIAYNAARNGKNVAYFTIEMSKWKVQTRLDSLVTGIPFRKFRMATLTDRDKNRWEEKIDHFNNNFGKIYVVGFYKGCTPDSTEVKARDIEQLKGMPIDIMVIDYLNDIQPNNIIGSAKNWESQGDVSWQLKNIAQSWNNGDGIPVVTASQRKSAISGKNFIHYNNGFVGFKKMNWNDPAFSQLPANHATVIIGIILAKKEDNGIGIVMNHQVVKNRDGDSSLGVVSFPNLAICRINSNKKYRLMKQEFRGMFEKQKKEIEKEVEKL